MGMDEYEGVMRETEPLRDAVLAHPMYAEIQDLASLRIFMERHVFAVWDSMALLKSLQRQFAGTAVPWIPPQDTYVARLLNERVLSEESDELAPGLFGSHFELYLAAMGELDADRGPVRGLTRALAAGTSLEDAFVSARVPTEAREFVRTTLRHARCAPLQQTAGAWLFGREALVPAMCTRLHADLIRHGADEHGAFARYLTQHTGHVCNATLARRLMTAVCGRDATRWAEAAEAAREALRARLALWNATLDAVRNDPNKTRRLARTRVARPIPAPPPLPLVQPTPAPRSETT